MKLFLSRWYKPLITSPLYHIHGEPSTLDCGLSHITKVVHPISLLFSLYSLFIFDPLNLSAMKWIILLLFILVSYRVTLAQNVGIGTTTPNNSAVLDISSTNKGLLIPRLHSVDRVLIPNAANGLLAYDTTVGRLYQYQEGAWRYFIDDSYWRKSGSRNWVFNSGDSVAIGTPSASQRLDVNGNIRTRDNLIANGNVTADGAVIGGTLQTPGNLAVAGIGYIVGNITTNANLAVGGNSTTEGDVIIKNNGASLHLRNAANESKGFYQLSGNDVRFGTNAGNSTGDVIVRMNGNNRFQFTQEGRLTLLADATPTIHFNTGGTNKAYIQLQGDNLRLDAPDNKLYLGDDMVVDDATGRIGIGTINPLEKLHVSGNLRTAGNAKITGKLSVDDSIVTYDVLYGGSLSVAGGDTYGGMFSFGGGSYANAPYSGAIGNNARVQGAFNSVVIGTNVGAARDGCLVLADARPDRNFISFNTRPHTMYGMFYGGYRLFTGIGTGVEMENGDNSWSSISDSTKKENFLYADGNAFLQKIAKMKLGSWNYKIQDKSKRHYGPMAQEFHANFGSDGLGKIGNDTTIATADIDGVMMIALQALEKRTSDQQATIDQLKTEINDLKAILAEQKKLLLELKGTNNTITHSAN